MFRRILLPPLLLAAALLADTAIIPVISTHWLIPLASLVLTLCLGLLLGRSRGTIYGVAAGLLMDITVSTPLGLMTAAYGAMGLLGGALFRLFPRSRVLPPVAAALGFLGFELYMIGYQALTVTRLEPALLLHALGRLALEIALTEGGYLVIRRMLGLRPSRPAA